LIANGDRGADSIIYSDKGNAAKWAQYGVAHLHRTVADIPTDLLPKPKLQSAGSRPDIILYRRKSVKRTQEGQCISSPAQIALAESSTQGIQIRIGHMEIHIISMSICISIAAMAPIRDHIEMKSLITRNCWSSI
jgi:hypothetical protein